VATADAANSTPTISDFYSQALDTASSATAISQSAQSTDDWNLVVSHWQQAIELMKAVPASSPEYARASSKIAEYQQQISIAQQQAIAAPRLPAAIAEASTPDTESQLIAATPGVFIAKIKRRISRTPVIEVTFNGKHTVEMIVDSGASATVITPAMADKIGVRPEDEVMADTASAKRVKFRTGKVESIEVEGAVVTDVQVAIAASHLDTGLLGQDFLSNYDVWIKGDVVEFHSRL